jgi:iron complex outermembrane receptor protein
VNIILKKQTNFTEVSLTSGVTSERSFNLELILTQDLKLHKGFVNFNVSYLAQNKTNRAENRKDDLFG